MNLHLNPKAFNELIIGAANQLAIPAPIIEKDYFVTLSLRQLALKIPNMVFKGGTSLTKCYQLLDRFSEDIDISYTEESGTPGDARKRQLKKAVTSTMDDLGFPITNLDATRSRRHYNCYRASYPSMYEQSNYLKPELVVETYVALLPFPTTTRNVDNYLYRFLNKISRLDLAEEYDLNPFPITTQTIERTLIDKIFALCDYYLTDNIEGHSRHIYDIYKIVESIGITDTIPPLIPKVRSVRSNLSICPSAADGINISVLLSEMIEKEIYKNDYNNITINLLFVPTDYETVIHGLEKIIKCGIF